ncbi:MAG: NAD(P)H-binding protein [Myxococcota bacterium]
MKTVVVGATGFVGRHLMPFLDGAGHRLTGTTRQPESARRRWPGRSFVHLDVVDPESMRRALAGQDAAVYLVHSMADRGDYEVRERRTAEAFAGAAKEAGLRRVVYLGGVRPQGEPSKHLRSRLSTGAALRAGEVSTIELGASMIIGAGSASFCIVRDLATRLPAMVLPRWLRHRTQPIALDDVCAAIDRALRLDHRTSGVYPIPGPEGLTGVEILQRVAALEGVRPVTVSVPLVSPRLSSFWIQLVTRADARVASQLVEGLTCDLMAEGETFWKFMPDHRLMSFDEAARRALEVERQEIAAPARMAERLVRMVSLSPPPPEG